MAYKRFHRVASTFNSPYLSLSSVFFLLALVPLIYMLIPSMNVMESVVRWFVLGYSISLIITGLLILISLPLTQRVALFVLAFGQIFWYAFPALTKALVGLEGFSERVNYNLSQEDILYTAVYLIVFAVVSLSTYVRLHNYFVTRSCKATKEFNETPSLNDRQIVLVIILLVILGLLPFALYGGSLGEIVQGILGSRALKPEKGWATTSFDSQPLYVIGRACLVTAGSYSLLQILSAHRKFYVRCIGFFGFILAFVITYFDSGTRSWTILIVLPSILLAFRKSIAENKYKRWLVAAPILFLIIFWVAQLQIKFRNTGFDASTVQAGDALEIWDNDFFSETAVAINLVPAQMDYLYESTTVLFITNIIPRIVWPDKPFSDVIHKYSMGRRGYDEWIDKGTNSLPGVVGQYYMSWGLLGVIEVSIFFGLIMAWIDTKLRLKGISPLMQLLMTTMCIWLFVGFRGLWPGFHYPIIIIAVIVLYEKYQGRAKLVPSVSTIPVHTYNYLASASSITENKNS